MEGKLQVILYFSREWTHIWNWIFLTFSSLCTEAFSMVRTRSHASNWNFSRHFEEMYIFVCTERNKDSRKRERKRKLFFRIFFLKNYQSIWDKIRKKSFLQDHMRCLPQRLKSTFFEFFSNGLGLREQNFFQKNVHFSHRCILYVQGVQYGLLQK